MKIYVKYRGKGTLVLRAKPEFTVLLLKHMLAKRIGLQVADQIVTYTHGNAEIILEDPYNLEFYGVSKGACLILKRENGGRPRGMSESLEVDLKVDEYRHTFHTSSQGDPSEEFFEACKQGDFDGVVQALERDAAVVRAANREGWSGVHIAAFHNRDNVLEILVDYSADMNGLSRDGKWAPLHLACIQGHSAIVKFLLGNPMVDIDLLTESSGTPLHCACLAANKEIVELLLQSKANYSIENKKGQLPIEVTISPDVKALLAKYMGQVGECPEGLEGILKVPRLLAWTAVWAELKPQDGVLGLYTSRASRRENQMPLQLIPLRNIREVRRCKGGFFSSANHYYFHIVNSTGERSLYFVDSEELVTQWVLRIFTAVLYKQNFVQFPSLKKKEYTLEDFPHTYEVSYYSYDILEQIGTGSFGQVYLVRDKNTAQLFAMKTMAKDRLLKKGYVKYAVAEARILHSLCSPFIVALHHSFHTARSLYLIMDYCPNGSLYDLLQKMNYLPEEYARVYIAELVLAIEHLHGQSIIYRDMKPENVLLDASWHIKLSDFGLSKECIRDGEVTRSFCGSPAYLSPEMLMRKGVGKAADIYGVGCMLYEILCGYPPYFSESMTEIFLKIQSGRLKFPTYVSAHAQHLCSQMLERDPVERPSLPALKLHPFFQGIDWEALSRGARPELGIPVKEEVERELVPSPVSIE